MRNSADGRGKPPGDSPVPPADVPRRRGRPRKDGAARPDTGQVQSLLRGLGLLERLAETDQGMGLTELALAVGLAPSTAHRLLRSLEKRHFVHHDAERGLWFIGVRAFAIGNAFLRGQDFVALAWPVMRRLMESVGETVNLAVLEGGHAVYLAQVECHEVMRASARPGARAPLHGSGVGKALLAAVPAEEAAALLGKGPLPRFTPKTVTAPADLRPQLPLVRRQGFAVDDEEQTVGMRCVAAPVFGADGRPVAAVSVSGPTARIGNARMAELGRRVAQAAREITVATGGKPPA